MKQNQNQLKKPKSVDEVDTCHRCGNIYILMWLKEGDDFNDFGDRHCPFCGLLTEEFCLKAGD